MANPSMLKYGDVRELRPESPMPIDVNAGVTVTLVARNAGSLLARVLERVRSQRSGREIEIVLIDTGSSDGTAACAESFGARVIRLSADAGFGAARSRAYAEARLPVLVNLSQDAVPATENWLESLLAPLADPAVGVVCGTSLPDPDRETPQFAWERNGYFYFTREMRKFAGQYGRGVSFANSALRRETWEQLGLGPQSIGEDFQFQQRVHAAGLRVVFTADAPVLHHHDYTLDRLWLRCRNEGLVLRELGCPYTLLDLAADLAHPAKNYQWLREIRHGRLRSPAEFLFPVVRPFAVYAGSRFARRHVWR